MHAAVSPAASPGKHAARANFRRMAYTAEYAAREPARDDIDAAAGPMVVEFGAPWCGFCIGAQRAVEAAFNGHEDVRHVKVEDGRGRPLGRSFKVKLWPTLVFLRDGEEVDRLVRPASEGEIRGALKRIDGAG